MEGLEKRVEDSFERKDWKVEKKETEFIAFNDQNNFDFVPFYTKN